MAEAMAEAPNGVVRALLYIVGASPSFLLHPSYKLFYHTFHHTQSVPFVEPALLVQPLVFESASLPVQSNSFVVKLALSFQTVESGLPVLPLIEPVLLASPVPVLSTEFLLQATIESNPPTLSIIQEALEMQVLTEQNVEEKEAVYNEKCFWSVAEIFTTNEASLSGSLRKSSTEAPLIFSLFLINILMLLARLFVGLLYTHEMPRLHLLIYQTRRRLGEGGSKRKKRAGRVFW